MKLKNIRLINFKKFDEEVSFDFKDTNLILGKNGEGKTAIKDALIFCLYNRTPDGSLSDSPRHITNGKIKCLVELIFENNNKTHTIRRERTYKQTRITYQDGSQSQDDSKITQETLESLIPSFKNFSAVFNIGWFMSLTDREKRDYILELTPKIDRISIFEKLGGKEEYIEKFGLFFDNLDRTHKNLLTIRLENEKEIEAMQIFMRDSLPIDIPINSNTESSIELGNLKKLQEDSIKIDYQWKEYERIKEHNISVETNNKELEKKISEIEILNLSIPNQDKINSLISKKNEYTKQISLPKETCPTCFQDVSIDHRNKIKKINDENKANLEKIEKILLAEQRSYKESLEEYNTNEENKKKKLMYETQFGDPIVNTKPELSIIEVDTVKITNIESEQEKYILQENTIKVLTEQEKHRLKKIEKYRDNIVVLKHENETLTKLISIFSPKGIPAEEMNQKLEPLKEQFQKLLPKSDIITLEPLKNEMGYKEVFRVLVDGKDYDKLSLGEKTRVDISLSQIINSMLPEKIDMFFLDNSEILDSSISLPVQSFICKVNNKQLKIN